MQHLSALARRVAVPACTQRAATATAGAPRMLHALRASAALPTTSTLLRAASARSARARVSALAPIGARGFASDHGGYNYGRRATTPRNMGWAIVPEQSAYVVERLGKYSKTLSPGFHLLLPGLDRIAYVQNLKEEAIPVSGQMAITADNVTIHIDGVLYLRIVDAKLASYGVSDIYFAMVQLAQTTMRSAIGKLTLDATFAGRDHLNSEIVNAINAASEPWGVTCMRYEIKDITPPVGVKQAMDSQAEAERRKRATVLDSEGSREAEVNVAEGGRKSTVLQASGEAEAIIVRAEATAKSIIAIAQALSSPGGRDAVSLNVAEKYVEAFGNIAKQGNTMLLPSNAGDPAAMVAQALGIFDVTRQRRSGGASAAASSSGSPADQYAMSAAEKRDFDLANRMVDAEERERNTRQ